MNTMPFYFNLSRNLWLIGLMLPVLFSCKSRKKDNPKPNFIVIFCDDLGYGDLGCFGSEVHQTPHIDQMAEEGVKLTSFYSTCSVSTPSRASLLTGCYPQRIDMAEMKKEGFRSVLTPQAQKGLNPSEITIAEILKKQGYATACIGKWHLVLPLENRFKAHYTDETEKVETQLFNLNQDIGEEHNVASENPQVVKDLMRKAEMARKTLGSQDNPSVYVRPAGRVLAPESLQNSKNE
jgi:arylsulfatase A-like enzyme